MVRDILHWLYWEPRHLWHLRVVEIAVKRVQQENPRLALWASVRKRIASMQWVLSMHADTVGAGSFKIRVNLVNSCPKVRYHMNCGYNLALSIKKSGVKYRGKNLKYQRSREQPLVASYLLCSSIQKGQDRLTTQP